MPDETKVTCADCEAVCCRLEVLLITDTGVPGWLIETDQWGGTTMARLADGWCAALDRNTLLCSVYEKRPWVCREYEMGGPDCIAERQERLGRAQAAGVPPVPGAPDRCLP